MRLCMSQTQHNIKTFVYTHSFTKKTLYGAVFYNNNEKQLLFSISIVFIVCYCSLHLSLNEWKGKIVSYDGQVHHNFSYALSHLALAFHNQLTFRLLCCKPIFLSVSSFLVRSTFPSLSLTLIQCSTTLSQRAHGYLAHMVCNPSVGRTSASLPTENHRWQ